MEDAKSYTVRTETGEIHLMSQEEVSSLVRATMARARNNSRVNRKLSTSRDASSSEADLSRRFSLASRYSAGKGAQGVSSSDQIHPEEISTSATKKPFESVDAPSASSPLQEERKQSRKGNSRRVTKNTSRSIQNMDERFASLVRSVGPLSLDRDHDPESVSFTVSTEVDGQKNLSEKELTDLVRNSVVRARSKAQRKGFARRNAESRKSRFATTPLSDGSLSPRKSLNRKFSWSTVEQSDNEFDDARDDEMAERGEGHERCESEDVEIVTQRRELRLEKEDAIVEPYQTSEVEEIFSTPCTSPKTTKVLSPRPTSSDHRSWRGYETPSLSLVLSTGGDSVLSDRAIYQMVKQSMDKAKQTRQEITDLLEDTPSGVCKVDVADIVEGTMRRARDTARSLEIPSLSPRKQPPVAAPRDDSVPVTPPVAEILETESVPVVASTDIILGISISIDEATNVNVVQKVEDVPALPLDEGTLPKEENTTSISPVPSALLEPVLEEVLVVSSSHPKPCDNNNLAIAEVMTPVTETAVIVHRSSCFDAFCCCSLELDPMLTQEDLIAVPTIDTQSQEMIEENSPASTDGVIVLESEIVDASQPVPTGEELTVASSAMEAASSTADGLMVMLQDEPAQVMSEVVSMTIEENPSVSSLAVREVLATSKTDENLGTDEPEKVHHKDIEFELPATNDATGESIEVSRINTYGDLLVDGTQVSKAMSDKTESLLEKPQNEDTDLVLPENIQDPKKPNADIDIPMPSIDPSLELCEQDVSKDSLKARRKHRRLQNRSKYRRQRKDEMESVITDEFLAEVKSMKGLKITASKLAQILQSTNSMVSRPESNRDNNVSKVRYASADESIASNLQTFEDSLANEDAIQSPVQSPGFCADFLSIFSDPFEADDDFGSVSLYNNESAVDTLSKKDSQRDRTVVSISGLPTPKSTEYESELAPSYGGRRLTFSFSEGRYTVSMSLSDEY